MKTEVIKEVVSLNMQFHEVLSIPLVSERSLQIRKKLLALCTVAFAIVWGGLMPTEIPLLGIKVTMTNLGVLYFGFTLVILYSFVEFWWKAEMEFLNIKNLKRSKVLYLESKKKELSEKHGEDAEVQSFLDAIDFTEEDQYRKNALGSSFRALLNELYFPVILTAMASISCIYKGIVVLL